MLNSPDDYLYLNYLGLHLCIDYCVPIGKVLNALRRETLGEERPPQVHIPMSDEEWQAIFRLHKQGLSNSEIARQLGHDTRDRVANALSRYRKKQEAKK